ncbi:MAG: right-handed parallel beta-helix repeat-containing protein, partial [Bacteroidota bacterium]
MKLMNSIRYLLVSVFLSLSGMLTATNYYVDVVNGSDVNIANNGLTTTTAVKTIKKGITLLSSGDVLYIMPGIYPEKLPFYKSDVSITAYDSLNRPIILPPASDTLGATVQVMTLSANNVSFSHLIFDGINLKSRVIDVGGNNVTFRKCVIRNGYQSGFLTSGPDTNLTRNHKFIDLDVYGNGRENEGSHGFYLVCPEILIENCRIHDNGGYGIKLGTNPANNARNTRNVTVRNNLVYRNSGKSGIGINHVDVGILVYNNVCYSNGDAGIDLSYNTSNVKVFNNTCYSNNAGIYMAKVTGPSGNDNGVQHVEIANNILFNNDLLGNVYFYFPNPADTSDIKVHDNFYGNPWFVDHAGGDFRLTLGSPAINAGITIADVTTDLLGVSRPQNGAYDYGAYEGGVDMESRRDFYVDSLSGNDTNAGTFSYPYRTLNKGINGLVAGDILHVMNGTYVETISTYVHGTSADPIVIKAYTGHHPVIKPGNINNQCIVGFRYYNDANIASYIEFDGFTINCMDTPAWGIVFDKAHHITVKNCEVTNSKAFWPAIHSRLAAHDLTFDKVHVHDNRSIGFHLTTNYNTLLSCHVHNNPKEGIIAGSNAILIGNNAHHNTYYGIGVGANSIVYNNVSWYNGAGISVGGAGVKVYNNTVARNSDGIILSSTATGFSVKNNISINAVYFKNIYNE